MFRVPLAANLTHLVIARERPAFQLHTKTLHDSLRRSSGHLGEIPTSSHGLIRPALCIAVEADPTPALVGK